MSPSSLCGRMLHRTFVILVLAAVLAAVLALTASSATGKADPAGQAQFRRDLTAYLVQMQQVGMRLKATPQGRAGFARLRYDPAKGMARARAEVQHLSPAQLAALQRAFSAYPAWRTIPARLKLLTARLPRGHRAVFITPDDCATARAAGITQTDVEIAADLAFAADVVLEAVPNDLLSEVVRAIAVGVWAIPNTTLRAFEHLYNIASACDDADHQALVQQNLDVAVSTRATQSSVDSLTNNFNSFNTTFNALDTLINNRLDVEVSSRASQASLTAFNNEFTTFHNEFTTNATTVNTKLDTINSSVNTANSKLDALTITVEDQGKLDLRLKIEEDLSMPGNHPIALFEVPASGGGYLDLTRDIVADTIAKMQAAGQGIGNATSFLAAGDAAVAAHAYKEAYADYGKAYRAAAGGVVGP
jgi:hypothetical protein